MLNPKEKHLLVDYCEKDAALARLLQKLQENQQQQLSAISHEIRNPVATIRGFLQLTQKQHPEVCNYVTWPSLLDNVDYLCSLLDELSQYNQAIHLHKESISLTNLLKSLTEECQTTFASTRITFIKKSAIPRASLDPVKLRSAVLNLIRNAHEALALQTDGQITVSLSFDGDLFHISVSNNGPEIPVEIRERIMEPFISFKKDGTGLGLAIVRSVAEAHGGKLILESTPKQTTFTLLLPFTG